MDQVPLNDIVNQDFSLIALFLRADPIVKSVMVILGGVATAWLVTACRFPGQRVFDMSLEGQALAALRARRPGVA